jgi:hypothetical protein
LFSAFLIQNVLTIKTLKNGVYFFAFFCGLILWKIHQGKVPISFKIVAIVPSFLSPNKMSDEEEFEEIERIVLGLEEVGWFGWTTLAPNSIHQPDSDLYDRVAYLDMVKAHQLERKRKFRSMANLEAATALKYVFFWGNCQKKSCLFSVLWGRETIPKMGNIQKGAQLEWKWWSEKVSLAFWSRMERKGTI